MTRRARTLIVAAALGLAAALGAARDARADGLAADEWARLVHGQTVTREQTLEQGSRHYVGGVTYTLLDATPEEVDLLMDDVAAYKRILPKTKEARLVGRNGPDAFVELHQGTALIDAAYTIRIRRAEPPPAGSGLSRGEIRFWLDPTKPHAISDAWGFFRYELVYPDGESGQPKVLLTYGVLVDLGPGLVRDLFEERVRSAMLSVPQRVKGYVAENVRERAAL